MTCGGGSTERSRYCINTENNNPLPTDECGVDLDIAEDSHCNTEICAGDLLNLIGRRPKYVPTHIS